MADFILALDQGTTSSRAIVFDRSGAIRTQAQKGFPQLYPQPGWVEHDPDNGGVYLVPAFVGLGAPHCDPYARNTIEGWEN